MPVTVHDLFSALTMIVKQVCVCQYDRARHSTSHFLLCPLGRHVSFVQICDCRIFHLLPHFSHISAKCAYRIFPQKLALSMAVLILCVFLLPISVRFHYLDHLIANRMAPSMCPDPCGTRWGSWFQEILYNISATYLVFMRSAHFLKCSIKMTCLTG